jgi:hypothetical protein
MECLCWVDGAVMRIPIADPVFTNVDETALKKGSARLENCYVTKQGTLSRFPMLVPVATVPTKSRVYLKQYQEDLIAVSGGRLYTSDKNLTLTDRTEATLTGNGRVVFAETDDEMVMAAGGSLVVFDGNVTRILSKDAPQSTHVAYVDGYLVAIEPNSGRFRHNKVGEIQTWDDLDTFSADGKPDNLNSMLLTEFNELILGGTASMEQYDTAGSGKNPFARRWFLGSGVYAPHTLISVDNRVWGINSEKEFVAFSSQLGNIESDNIQSNLDAVDDWTDAWAAEMPIDGQRFIILQIPFATNIYENKGITLLFDYRSRRWSSLYSWDQETALPVRWDGWSYARAYGKHYVGGEGIIYELKAFEPEMYQRMLWRSAVICSDENYDIHCNRLTMRVKRGVLPYDKPAPAISVRVNKNNRGWSKWVRGSLGRAGDEITTTEWASFGVAKTWQFEIMAIDAGQVEVSSLDADFLKLRK